MQDYSKARKYLEKLVTVDPSTAWAHEARAMILWMYDRNWEEADKEYQKAVELDAPRLYRYGDFLEWMGRRDENLAWIEGRLQVADPFAAATQTMAGWQLLWAGEYDRAVVQAEKALQLEPEWVDPLVIISFSYELRGMEKEAFEAALESMKSQGADAEELRAARESFKESGMKGVRRLNRYHRQEDRSPRPIQLAMDSLRLGDKDLAFEWLERSWEQPLWGTENAPSSPLLDPIREDPRFEELLRKQKLPEEVIARHLAR
jgi:tetratricopeptide (TPR) repeat protein